MSEDSLAPKRTPLWERHRQAGAKLVDFAGWEMPVQYAGVIDEHRAVRGKAGLFDVSHMGEFEVTGPGAEAFLQRVTPNDVSKLKPGRAHYSGLLTEEGTYVDDLLVYRLDSDRFLLVVNASNIEKDFAWLESRRADEVLELEDRSDRFALLALQGPAAQGILQKLTDQDLPGIRYYHFVEGLVAGREMIISRTGYTGEDGFELYLKPEDAPGIWDRILEAGGPEGVQPAGLGARDTLRLEASMALYGHEIDDTTTPLEAGLRWVVKFSKGEFVGSAALVRQKEEGLQRKLIGFEVTGRGIARQGHSILIEDQEVGKVTSGTWSPHLEKAVGMGYLPLRASAPGTEISIEVRRRRLPAVIVEMPFYRRSS